MGPPPMTFDPYKPPQSEPAYLREAPRAAGFEPTRAGLVASICIGAAVAVEAVVTVIYFADIDPAQLTSINQATQMVSGALRLVGVIAFLIWTHRVVSNA